VLIIASLAQAAVAGSLALALDCGARGQERAGADLDPRARGRPVARRAFAAYDGSRNGSELIALAAGGFLIAAIGARTTVALAGRFRR
jgi:hypothetical protein